MCPRGAPGGVGRVARPGFSRWARLFWLEAASFGPSGMGGVRPARAGREQSCRDEKTNLRRMRPGPGHGSWRRRNGSGALIRRLGLGAASLAQMPGFRAFCVSFARVFAFLRKAAGESLCAAPLRCGRWTRRAMMRRNAASLERRARIHTPSPQAQGAPAQRNIRQWPSKERSPSSSPTP